MQIYQKNRKEFQSFIDENKNISPIELAKFLEKIGWESYQYGDYMACLKSYHEAITVLINQPNSKQVIYEIGTCLNNFSAFVEEVGLLEKSLKMKEESLRLKSLCLGSNHPELNNIKRGIDLATGLNISFKQNKDFEDDIKAKKELLGENHLEIADSLLKWGDYKAGIDDHKGAIIMYNEARKRYKLQKSERYIFLGIVYGNIALSYHELGKNTKAEAKFQKALDILENILVPCDSLATTYFNFAEMWENLGKPRKACQYYKKHISTMKQIQDNIREAINYFHSEISQRPSTLQIIQEILEKFKSIETPDLIEESNETQQLELKAEDYSYLFSQNFFAKID